MDENNRPNEEARSQEEEAWFREMETEQKLLEAEYRRLTKKAKERERWLRFRNLASVVTLVIGTLGVVVGISTLLPQRPNTTFGIEDQQEAIIDRLQRDFEVDLQELAQGIQELSNVPQNTSVGVNLKRLDLRLTSLDSRLEELEGVILEDPTKSLEIVLLRRDIGDITKDVSALQADIARGFDRIYSLGTWLIGLLLPLFVTLVLSSLNNLRNQSKNNQPES